METYTAVMATVAAIASLWNTYQLAVLKGRVDTLETSHNVHVNATAAHR